jgi:hypothetical protein
MAMDEGNVCDVVEILDAPARGGVDLVGRTADHIARAALDLRPLRQSCLGLVCKTNPNEAVTLLAVIGAQAKLPWNRRAFRQSRDADTGPVAVVLESMEATDQHAVAHSAKAELASATHAEVLCRFYSLLCPVKNNGNVEQSDPDGRRVHVQTGCDGMP